MRAFQVAICALAVVTAAQSVMAQPAVLKKTRCLPPLKRIGRLYAEANSEFKGDRQLKFPKNFDLGHSRQSTGYFSGNGAKTDMQPGNVPDGLDLEASGDKEWAVSQPRIGRAFLDDGTPVWALTMYMYCSTGQAVVNQFQGGCHVHVDVCARPGERRP
jgi:hypothetical protein